MTNAQANIIALINTLNTNPTMVVSVDKARQIARMMNAAAECNTHMSHGGDYHGFFLEVEGVGVVKLVVSKNAYVASKRGAVLSFTPCESVAPAAPVVELVESSLDELAAAINAVNAVSGASFTKNAARTERPARFVNSEVVMPVEAGRYSGRRANGSPRYLRRGRSLRSC